MQKPILTATDVAEIRNVCATAKGAPLTDDEMEMVTTACTYAALRMRARWREDMPGMVVTSLEETPDELAA